MDKKTSFLVCFRLKTARSVSDDAYHNLIKMVNALAMVEGIENYEEFID